MGLKMVFSFGFWFGNNSCMLTLPMVSFSYFVFNSLAFVLAIYPSVSKIYESELVQNVESLVILPEFSSKYDPHP